MIKSFKIGGKEFKVVQQDHDSSNLGKSQSPIGEIHVQSKWEGKEVPADSMEQTMYHEVVHCILTEIGRDDLSSDECFVQSFSLLLHQFEKTKLHKESEK